MKRIFLIAIFTLGLAIASAAQITVTVRKGAALPSTCSPTNVQTLLFYKTGSSNGLYQCTSTNTWTPLLSSASIDAALATKVPITLTVNGHALSANVTLVKGDIGLGNVDNTSDINKPVSTAQQAAIDLKAALASPAFTGNPTAPTQTAGDNSTRIATTAFVQAAGLGGGSGSGGGSVAPIFDITNPIYAGGAVGDGSHDDGPAMQAAISAACINKGGAVVIPKPNAAWIFANPLYIPKCTGVQIIGMGGGAVQNLPDTDLVVYTGTASPAIRASQANGMTIERVDWRYSNTSFTGDFFNLDAATTVTATFTRSSGNVFTTSSTAGLYTGRSSTVSTSGTLPSGLAPATGYYVIVLSPTTFSLATTYANAVAGTAITISSAGTGTQTFNAADDGNVSVLTKFYLNSFNNYGAAKAAGAGTARSQINLAGSINTTIERNYISFAKYGVIGYTSGDRDHFATAVTFKDNNHQYATVAAIANHDEAWQIIGDTFEFIYSPTSSVSGPAGAYINTVEGTGRSPTGLSFIGCGFWDTTSEGGSWITYDGIGLNVTDSFVQLGTAATFITSPNTGSGLTLQRNHFLGGSGATVVNNTGTLHDLVTFDDTNLVTAGIAKYAGNQVVEANMFRTTLFSTYPNQGNFAGTLTNLSSTYNLPANFIQAKNEALIFHATGTFAANADADKHIIFDLGGGTEFDSGALSVNGGSWVLDVEIVQATTGSNVQTAFFTLKYSPAPSGVVGAATTTLTLYKDYTLSWGSALPWSVKGNGTTANDVVLKAFQIFKQRA
jgi:hypothetical protein